MVLVFFTGGLLRKVFGLGVFALPLVNYWYFGGSLRTSGILPPFWQGVGFMIVAYVFFGLVFALVQIIRGGLAWPHNYGPLVFFTFLGSMLFTGLWHYLGFYPAELTFFAMFVISAAVNLGGSSPDKLPKNEDDLDE